MTVLHKDIGMAVRFECNVKPWIRVKWKKDGERFVLKKHPHFRSIRNISYPWSGSTSSLLFDARLKDSGEYECMGNYNGIWKKRKEWTLRVSKYSLFFFDFLYLFFCWCLVRLFFEATSQVKSTQFYQDGPIHFKAGILKRPGLLKITNLQY